MAKDKGSSKLDQLRAQREAAFERAQRTAVFPPPRTTGQTPRPVEISLADPEPVGPDPVTGTVARTRLPLGGKPLPPPPEAEDLEPGPSTGKRGRPSLPAEEKLGPLTVMLPPRERADLGKLAAEEGVPVAALLRTLVKEALAARRSKARRGKKEDV